jgi:hypothetical protein
MLHLSNCVSIMCRILICSFFFFWNFLTFSQVQDWSWARQSIGGSNSFDQATSVAADGMGNIYKTGRFSSSSITFSTFGLTNNGSNNTYDFFLVKYTSSGNVIWVRHAGGQGNEEGLSVSTDASGNIYVTGYFETTSLVFGTYTITNATGLPDIFVVKYDAAGNVLWAQGFGGSQLDIAYGITADGAGNTYITGIFSSLSVLFGNYGVINTGTNTPDAFIAKFNSSGVPQWAKEIGGVQDEKGVAVSIEPSGNVVVTGEYNSTTLSSYSLSNSGGYDVFFGKYDTNGNLLSNFKIGGSNDESPYSLVHDASGNMYVSITFESNTINVGSLTFNSTSTNDMLLVKYNASQVPQWGKRAHGSFIGRPSAVKTDPSGNVYLCGYFDTSFLSFGGDTVTNSSMGTQDIYLVKFNTSGTQLWGKSFGGVGIDMATCITTDNIGSIYLVGNYTPTITVGTNTLTGLPGWQTFITKLCVIPAQPVVGPNVTVCANKVGTLTATSPSGAILNWYNSASGGSPLLSGGNAFTVSVPGTYYVEALNTGNGCSNPNRASISFSQQPGASVSISGKTLTANWGGTYKWIECVKDSLMSAQTLQGYTLTQTGYYAVIVTKNGCVDTSACNFYSVNATVDTVIVTTKVKTISPNDHELEIFPNPNNGNVTLSAEMSCTLLLMNALGQLVAQLEISGNKDPIALHIKESGIYYLRSPDKKFTRKIVVIR